MPTANNTRTTSISSNSSNFTETFVVTVSSTPTLVNPQVAITKPSPSGIVLDNSALAKAEKRRRHLLGYA
jgi:hypothetical protein